jgi:hypothetical protein
MDWKLGGSGESGVGELVRLENLDMFDEGDSVKFTIASHEDYLQARDIYYKYIRNQYPVKVFAGVVWGKLTNEQLVEWMLQDGLYWHLNVQVHNHVWDRNKRGI